MVSPVGTVRTPEDLIDLLKSGYWVEAKSLGESKGFHYTAVVKMRGSLHRRRKVLKDAVQKLIGSGVLILDNEGSREGEIWEIYRYTGKAYRPNRPLVSVL